MNNYDQFNISPPPQRGIVNQKVTSYNYQYIEIEFDFIPSYAILNFYLINDKAYNFYGNVIIFKEESPAAWTDYSYYKLGKDNNLIFKDIKLNNNILSIRQSSSYIYYVQGVVF